MKIHHICIQTFDYNSSLSFYTQVLGFRIIQESKEFHGRDYNTWLELAGFMIELQTEKRDEPFSPYSKNSQGISHFCLYSEDFDKDYRKIKESTFVKFRQKNQEDIYDVENGRLFKITAPEGTIIEIRDQIEL